MDSNEELEILADFNRKLKVKNEVKGTALLTERNKMFNQLPTEVIDLRDTLGN